MKNLNRLLFLGIFLLMGTIAQAQNAYVGTWKTIDDNTGDAKSHVEIYEQGGRLYGKVVKLIDESKADAVCTECGGSKKNQKIVGLVIIENLKKKGNYYGGGRILDPENGNTYKCYIELKSNNKDRLEVRGFLGFAALGRSQIWHRVK